MSALLPSARDDVPADRTGRAWWSARATLARRRTGRFALQWSLGVGAAVIIAGITPFVAGDAATGDRVMLETMAADTLRSADRLRAAEGMVTAAESLLVDARATPRRTAVIPAPVGVPAATAVPPTIVDLTRRIDAARRARTAQAFLEVAAHPAVSGGPRMQAMRDSIRALDAAPDDGQRAQRLARFGVSITAMASYRRDVLLGEAGLPVARERNDGASLPDSAGGASVVRASSGTRDTLSLVAALATARDSLAARQRVHDSLTAAIRTRDSRPAATRPILARLAPALALLVLLVAGLLLRFVTALRAELDAPTLADAVEAERLTGARVLATVKDALLDGPARFKPSGVDPFRMLYLGLTATGTRARAAVITGPDLDISAATGARLAIAAAADHRNTLIVDLDPRSIALSRTFHERAEPGVRDVLARAFTWREVARPVGSSDGLTITLLPAGTERDDDATGEARVAVLAEFERLQSAHELTLAVAPLDGFELAMSLLPGSPVLLTAVAGETSIDALVTAVEAQRGAGRRVAGLVIWDAPRPQLPTRAELAAELSKRKGRTPGGSFEAVRAVVSGNQTDSKRP